MYGFFVCQDKKSGCCREVAISEGSAEIYHDVWMNFMHDS